ncbi:MFS transporter [Desulfoluna butyratoxydans]|uniref:Major facilitator superfamily n=1 Tax=Desulfoluna butyratoxydans TaxID=231438 RepID=A0A4U8YR86_9BACT|nr:MFS transporter [Desulfoluna butyratoxydans]VFQ46380.1 major facilitator superfamily [Desulfoluna butyratoxydans]
MTERNEALTANIARYPWYLFFRDGYFWGPVFFLYFSSVLSLSEALHLEAVYYVTVAAAEVPSGYLADRFGRRRTLMCSSGCLGLAYLLFLTGHTFWQFAAAQLFLAAGFASASGTDTALHYESLKDLGREAQYASLEGRALKYSLLAGGGAALLGGLAAAGHLRWVYGLSCATAMISLGIVMTMTEPEGAKGKVAAPFGPQLRHVLRKARGPRLRFFTLYALAMTVLLHIPYEFYQPYLKQALAWSGVGPSLVPPLSGMHLALTMVLGAFMTRFAGRIHHRCVVRRTLLACALLQVVLIGAMALVVHPLVALMLVGRTASRAVSTPLVNAELAPLLGRHERSTYFSLQSLLGRLAYGGALVMLSLGSGLFSDALHGALVCGLVLALFLFGGLFLVPFPWGEHPVCCRGGEHRASSVAHPAGDVHEKPLG